MPAFPPSSPLLFLSLSLWGSGHVMVLIFLHSFMFMPTVTAYSFCFCFLAGDVDICVKQAIQDLKKKKRGKKVCYSRHNIHKTKEEELVPTIDDHYKKI